jgi:hypothetical protein
MKNRFTQKIFLFAVSMSVTFCSAMEQFIPAVRNNDYEMVETIIAYKSSDQIIELLTPREGSPSLLAIAATQLHEEAVHFFVRKMAGGPEKATILAQIQKLRIDNETGAIEIELDLVGITFMQGIALDKIEAGIQIANNIMCGIGFGYMDPGNEMEGVMLRLHALLPMLIEWLSAKKISPHRVNRALKKIDPTLTNCNLAYFIKEIIIPALIKSLAPSPKRRRVTE